MSVKPYSNEEKINNLVYEKYCKENDESWENEGNIKVKTKHNTLTQLNDYIKRIEVVNANCCLLLFIVFYTNCH